MCLLAEWENLWNDAHHRVLGGHLRDAKVHSQLSWHYRWPGMRANITHWNCGYLTCAIRRMGRPVNPPWHPYQWKDPLTEWEWMWYSFPSHTSGASMQRFSWFTWPNPQMVGDVSNTRSLGPYNHSFVGGADFSLSWSGHGIIFWSWGSILVKFDEEKMPGNEYS